MAVEGGQLLTFNPKDLFSTVGPGLVARGISEAAGAAGKALARSGYEGAAAALYFAAMTVSDLVRPFDVVAQQEAFESNVSGYERQGFSTSEALLYDAIGRVPVLGSVVLTMPELAGGKSLRGGDFGESLSGTEYFSRCMGVFAEFSAAGAVGLQGTSLGSSTVTLPPRLNPLNYRIELRSGTPCAPAMGLPDVRIRYFGAETESIGRGGATKGETWATRAGRAIHKSWDYGPGFDTAVRLPSGRMPDAVNWSTKEVVELKPNNPRAIRLGERQLQRYIEELNREYGGGFTGRIITYDR